MTKPVVRVRVPLPYDYAHSAVSVRVPDLLAAEYADLYERQPKPPFAVVYFLIDDLGAFFVDTDGKYLTEG